MPLPRPVRCSSLSPSRVVGRRFIDPEDGCRPSTNVSNAIHAFFVSKRRALRPYNLVPLALIYFVSPEILRSLLSRMVVRPGFPLPLSSLEAKLRSLLASSFAEHCHACPCVGGRHAVSSDAPSGLGGG